jgi:DNA replication and repair protein RecF
LADGVNVFTGANAQGKTSILEAVCCLLRLQSPRTSSRKDLIRVESASFAVEGRFQGRKLLHSYDGSRRKLAVDGSESRKTRDYLESSGLVVWMGNDDLQLIKGSSENRRRYLDFIGAQIHPPYRPALKAYEKALRTRNFLLKAPSPNWAQIDAYGKILIDQGIILTAVRSALVTNLLPHAADAQEKVSGVSESLGLLYKDGSGEDYAAALRDSRHEERRLKKTVFGPHRDDLSISINGMTAGGFASEGQQRTVALALKLAQSRLLENRGGAPPIMLIDDIFGELDQARRNALLSYLPPGSQKLITTTFLDWADAPGGMDRCFEVSAGEVTAS